MTTVAGLDTVFRGLNVAGLTSRHALIALLLGICAPLVFGAPQELDRTVLEKVKRATVFVRVESPVGDGSGSGFLFVNRGASGYVITCEHVVGAHPFVQVVFDSGTPKERAFNGIVIGTDPVRDLACIIVKDAKDLPASLEIEGRTELSETSAVYAVGFPFGRLLAVGAKNPEVTISKSSVSSVRRNAEKRVTAVQLSGEVNPGNSGGPVIDPRGRVIGVTQSKIPGTSTAFAVPSEEVHRFLRGRPGSLHSKLASATPTSAKYDLTVGLLDPFATLKGVSVAWCAEKALTARPTPGAGGVWAKIHPSMKTLSLKKTEHFGTGVLEVTRAASDPLDLVLLLQITYTGPDGKVHWTEPKPLDVEFAEKDAPAKDSSIAVGEIKTVGTLRLQTAIGELLLSPDGESLYALDLSDAKIHKINPDTLEIAAHVDTLDTAVTMCMTPDGKSLYVACREAARPAKSGEIKVISTAEFKTVDTFPIAFAPFRLVATNSGILVATGAEMQDGLAIIDATRKAIIAAPGRAFSWTQVRLHPDQKRIYTSGINNFDSDFECMLLQEGPGGHRESWRSANQRERIETSNFEISPDGRFLIGYLGPVLKLGRSRETDLKFAGKIDPGVAIAVSRGSSTFVVATALGILKFYDLPGLELRKTVKIDGICSRLVLDAARRRLYALTSRVPAATSTYAHPERMFDHRTIRAGDITTFSLAGN